MVLHLQLGLIFDLSLAIFKCIAVNGQCTVCGGECDGKEAFSFRIDGSQVGMLQGRFPGMLFKSVDHS